MAARGGDPERDPNQDQGTTITNDPSYNAALDAAISQGNNAAQASANQQNLQDYLNQLYGSGGGGGGSKYAPFDVGGGKTKWDEFVQQMQLENEKLAQAQAIENARLAQEKALAEEKLQEEQKIADQNTVEAYNKNLTGMQGPKDPYGYLFQSRGLSAPQGYAPTAAPIPQAVLDQYKAEGVDLQQAQQQLVGGSGPSFINGYLGGMSNTFQQGPMGFQNSPSMGNVAPGSQPQPQNPPGMPMGGTQPTGNTPPPSGPPGGLPGGAPAHMATGGNVPGYSPGQDTVPAMLSPGEGVLRPQAVQAMGGPNVINELNAQSPNPSEAPKPGQQVTQGGIQKFAVGGIAGDAMAGQPYPQMTGPQGIANFYPMPAQSPTITPTQVGSNYQIAGQNVGQNTVENAPTAGYNMTAPGVAMPGATPQPSGPFPIDFVPGPKPINWPGWPGGNGFMYGGGRPMIEPQLGPTGIANFPRHPWSGGGIAIDPTQGGQAGIFPNPGGWIYHGPPPHEVPFGPGFNPQPLPAQYGPPQQPFNPAANPGVAQLTGGVQTPVGPAGGPVMNLNMLDPYTRAMVDQYGRPQIPSAQALANMPQSGLDAYQNYVEKVAGGNFQDLLDQSKTLNPAGENPANMKFS